MMSREVLKGILLEQRRKMEARKTEDLVKRETLEKIKDFAEVKHSIIITGPRRCGKSVFLSQIIAEFFDKYHYVNFEDERLADFELSDFAGLHEVCIELFGESKTFFLDEPQNVTGWEKWVRRMYDNGFKFFITGSNARLLSKELATVLTGRHIQLQIFPFSFIEFLELRKLGLVKDDVYISERRALIAMHFGEYLEHGGFPEYLKYKKIEILQEYFNDMVQRDVVERYNVKNVKQLKELARYILTNTGNLATYNQLKGAVELKSVNTAIKYVSYLENAYICFTVPYFSWSLKKQAANPFKLFAIDAGLRNAISFKFSTDMGRTYETVATIELKRRNKEIFYWKNQKQEEVDFVLKNGGKIEQLVQVCYNLTEHKVKEKETRSLLKAANELKCDDLLVLTAEYEADETVNGKTIKYVPLWKWLLTK